MELNLDFSFPSLGIMVGEIDELAEEIQREINRELRQIKLDNILKNELHQKNFEEGKDSQQSR